MSNYVLSLTFQFPMHRTKQCSVSKLETKSLYMESTETLDNNAIKVVNFARFKDPSPSTSFYTSSDDNVKDSSSFSNITETKTVLINALLITLQVLFELVPSVFGVIMVGHYYDKNSGDTEHISAVGLATTYSTVTGEAITWGFTTALYTLVPQAIGFGQNIKLVPIANQPIVRNALTIHLQRAIIITIIMGIPSVILQFFSGNFMSLIGEPSKIETIVRNYSISLIPWVVGSGIFTAMQRVMQAMGLNWMLFFVTAMNAIVSLPMMYLFMYTLNLGYLGAGIALSVSFWVMIILTVALLVWKQYGFLFNFRTFGFTTLLNKTDIHHYFKLCLPGLFQGMCEWWVLEIAILASGLVGDNDDQRTVSISSSVILYDLYIVLFAFATGMSSAINIEVAKYIGGNNIRYAKKVAKLSFIISISLCLFVCAIFIGFRDYIPLIFTHNNQTNKLVSSAIFAVSVFGMFLIVAQSFSGLYRGLAMQDKTAKFELTCYYLISIPLMFILLLAAS